MEEMRLPPSLPPPTVEIIDYIAAGLRYPGQREVVESTLSALEQYDGSVIATGTGTGKTFTAMAVARQRFDEHGASRQIIVAKNDSTITQDNGWLQVGRNFGFDGDNGPRMMPLPKDLTNLPEGIYYTTHQKLLRRRDAQRYKWDLSTIDESHEARKWYKKDSKLGMSIRTVSDNAKKAVYISATPFHTILKLAI